MWTHRQVTPFTRFLPVLSLATTEQHAILPSTFCAQLGKLYTSPRFRAPCFQSLGECPHNPFRDDEPVAGFIRETSANDSQILRGLIPFSQDFSTPFGESGLPLSRFHDEFTSPRIPSAALPLWQEGSYFRSLDDFQRCHSPLLIPSLSRAACRKNSTFPIEVFSTKDFRQCPGASNSTWILGPENRGRIKFQRTLSPNVT